MQVSTLLFAGGISAVLLAGYAGFRIWRDRRGVTLGHVLFGFMTIALVFAALVRSHLTATYPGVDRAALVIIACLILAGIAAAVLERRRQTPLNRTAGLVVAATGLLLGVLVLVTPLTVSQIAAARAQSAVTPSSLQAVAWVAAAQATPFMPTNTPSAQVTSAPQRTFALTPLPTRYVPTTPTAAVALDQAVQDGTLAAVCMGTVQNNLNLRTGAGTNYERVTTIPYGARITVYARNADSSWLAVDYENQTGWVSADYVVLDSGCDPLPQRDT